MIKDIMESNKTVTPNTREISILKEYFPSCFDKDGNFNIENFKKHLSDKVNITDESYELQFLGKNYARMISSLDTTTVIIPDKKHNSKPENSKSQNIYITGDNLDGLKHLLKSYREQIKCIYIDPPYNTGSDRFLYSDNFNFTAEELSDKLSISEEKAKHIIDITKRGSSSHAAWLMFMYPRLILARDLLSYDGVIFISIDDNEQADLKLICDDIFDESNYINTICIKAKASSGASGGGEDQRLKKNYETIFWYARKKDKLNFEPPVEKTLLTDYIQQHKENKIGFYYTRILTDAGTSTETAVLNKGTDEEIHIFTHEGYKFSSISEVCKLENISPEEAYKKYFNQIFMVTNAQTSILKKVNDTINSKGKLVSYKYIPKTGKSRGKEETKFIWNETLVVWLRDSSYIEGSNIIKTEKIGTLWDNISWGRLDIEGDMPYKNGKKPTALIRQLMNMVVSNGDIVVDFFSGSASTAHACMLESVNGKNIHSISIQIPENLDESIKKASGDKKQELEKIIDILDKAGRKHSLDEIGQERLVRAAKQIKDKNPSTDADLGFLHFTLAEPNAETLDKLEKFVPESGFTLLNNILQDFGVETVLTTWLVRDGYGFTAKFETVDFNGYSAYLMDKHLYLINPELSDQAITAIVEKYHNDNSFNPTNIVLFGYSFLWTEIDSLKTNLSGMRYSENKLHINFDIRY